MSSSRPGAPVALRRIPAAGSGSRKSAAGAVGDQQDGGGDSEDDAFERMRRTSASSSTQKSSVSLFGMPFKPKAPSGNTPAQPSAAAAGPSASASSASPHASKVKPPLNRTRPRVWAQPLQQGKPPPSASASPEQAKASPKLGTDTRDFFASLTGATESPSKRAPDAIPPAYAELAQQPAEAAPSPPGGPLFGPEPPKEPVREQAKKEVESGVVSMDWESEVREKEAEGQGVKEDAALANSRHPSEPASSPPAESSRGSLGSVLAPTLLARPVQRTGASDESLAAGPERASKAAPRADEPHSPSFSAASAGAASSSQTTSSSADASSAATARQRPPRKSMLAAALAEAVRPDSRGKSKPTPPPSPRTQQLPQRAASGEQSKRKDAAAEDVEPSQATSHEVKREKGKAPDHTPPSTSTSRPPLPRSRSAERPRRFFVRAEMGSPEAKWHDEHGHFLQKFAEDKTLERGKSPIDFRRVFGSPPPRGRYSSANSGFRGAEPILWRHRPYQQKDRDLWLRGQPLDDEDGRMGLIRYAEDEPPLPDSPSYTDECNRKAGKLPFYWHDKHSPSPTPSPPRLSRRKSPAPYDTFCTRPSRPRSISPQPLRRRHSPSYGGSRSRSPSRSPSRSRSRSRSRSISSSPPRDDENRSLRVPPPRPDRHPPGVHDEEGEGSRLQRSTSRRRSFAAGRQPRPRSPTPPADAAAPPPSASVAAAPPPPDESAPAPPPSPRSVATSSAPAEPASSESKGEAALPESRPSLQIKAAKKKGKAKWKAPDETELKAAKLSAFAEDDAEPVRQQARQRSEHKMFMPADLKKPAFAVGERLAQPRRNAEEHGRSRSRSPEPRARRDGRSSPRDAPADAQRSSSPRRGWTPSSPPSRDNRTTPPPRDARMATPPRAPVELPTPPPPSAPPSPTPPPPPPPPQAAPPPSLPPPAGTSYQPPHLPPAGLSALPPPAGPVHLPAHLPPSGAPPPLSPATALPSTSSLHPPPPFLAPCPGPPARNGAAFAHAAPAPPTSAVPDPHLHAPQHPAMPPSTAPSQTGTPAPTRPPSPSAKRPASAMDPFDEEYERLRKQKRRGFKAFDEDAPENSIGPLEGVSDLHETYAFGDKVGEGTFGVVFKATRVSDNLRVAIKKIMVLQEKDGFPITSVREIMILKLLKHPSIVPLIDMTFGPDPGDPGSHPMHYMVFPYMAHDLTGLLENPNVKFSGGMIKHYMKQLMEGTAFMHRNHIVHRDMKAANLLISEDHRLQIADFGLARLYHDDNSSRPDRSVDKMQKYTNMVVTRFYRPPELLLGGAIDGGGGRNDSGYGFYGPEIDLWGVGCIFGEMFKKAPILKGSTDIGQLDEIFSLCGDPTEENWPGWWRIFGEFEPLYKPRDPPRPSRIKEQFDADLGPEGLDLLSRLLCLDPLQRISAFDALDHDYFWTKPYLASKEELDSVRFPSSHEYDRRKNNPVPQPNRPVQQQMPQNFLKPNPGMVPQGYGQPPPRPPFAPRPNPYSMPPNGMHPRPSGPGGPPGGAPWQGASQHGLPQPMGMSVPPSFPAVPGLPPPSLAPNGLPPPSHGWLNGPSGPPLYGGQHGPPPPGSHGGAYGGAYGGPAGPGGHGPHGGYGGGYGGYGGRGGPDGGSRGRDYPRNGNRPRAPPPRHDDRGPGGPGSRDGPGRPGGGPPYEQGRPPPSPPRGRPEEAEEGEVTELDYE